MAKCVHGSGVASSLRLILASSYLGRLGPKDPEGPPEAGPGAGPGSGLAGSPGSGWEGSSWLGSWLGGVLLAGPGWDPGWEPLLAGFRRFGRFWLIFVDLAGFG